MTAGQDGQRANIPGGAGPPPLGAGIHRGIHWLGHQEQGVRSPWSLPLQAPGLERGIANLGPAAAPAESCTAGLQPRRTGLANGCHPSLPTHSQCLSLPAAAMGGAVVLAAAPAAAAAVASGTPTSACAQRCGGTCLRLLAKAGQGQAVMRHLPGGGGVGACPTEPAGPCWRCSRAWKWTCTMLVVEQSSRHSPNDDQRCTGPLPGPGTCPGSGPAGSVGH